MAGSATKSRRRRRKNINLRVSRGQKFLIDRAAQALGRSRSDFMLETACREAETILLDRRYFALPEKEFKRFNAMLDKPPASNPSTSAVAQDTVYKGESSRQPIDSKKL